MRAWAACALVLWLACIGQAANLRPSEMTVVVVSVARWPKKAGLDGFKVEDRQELDLVYALTARGVREERMTLLRDAEATKSTTLSAIKSAAATAPKGGILLIYLQGHGLKLNHKTLLALHDYDPDRAMQTGLPLDELSRTIIDSWRGGSLILMGDFCYAGGLDMVARCVSLAGRGPAAAVCSAVASDRATSRWTFLDAVVQGLSGDADVDENRDGIVTFRELSNWVIGSMVHGEDQMAEASMTPDFTREIPMAKVAPHTHHPPAPDGRRPGDGVEALAAEGEWYSGRLLRYEQGYWRVRFSGMGPEEDEWVLPSKLRPPTKSPWRAGASVEVEWLADEWYAARIMLVAGARMHFVHYEDTDGKDDEWVPASRIRQRGAGTRSSSGPPSRSRARSQERRPSRTPSRKPGRKR